MSRNQQRNTETPAPTSADAPVEPVEPTIPAVEPVEPTIPAVEPVERDLDALDPKPALVDALRTAWQSAATSENAVATGGVQVLDADLAPVIDAYRGLSPAFTKNERTSLVASMSAELSAAFLADGNLSATMATFQIRTALDAVTTKVAVVIDENREQAIRVAAVRQLAALVPFASDAVITLADQLPADDPQVAALFGKLVGLVERKTGRGSGSTGSTGERRAPMSVDDRLRAVVEPEPISYSKLAAKDPTLSGGALLNAWTSIREGKRSIAGVSAVEHDGKKCFVAA